MTQSHAVTTRNADVPAILTETIAGQLPTLNKLLPPDIQAEEFRAATWLTLQGTKGLAECTPQSVATALVKAATYGMLPGRDCYILPFYSKRDRGKVATFVAGYEGIIRALDRTGKVAKAFAQAVYSRDEFELDYGQDTFRHVPPRRGQRGAIDCYYGCIVMKDGTRHVQLLTLEEIEKIKRSSPAHEHGPWVDWPEAMARKTALKQVAKYVQLTQGLSAMLADDDTRMATDIPVERARTAVVELFGDECDPTAYDAGTGEVVESPAPEDQPISYIDRPTIAHRITELRKQKGVKLNDYVEGLQQQYGVKSTADLSDDALVETLAKLQALPDAAPTPTEEPWDAAKSAELDAQLAAEEEQPGLPGTEVNAAQKRAQEAT